MAPTSRPLPTGTLLNPKSSIIPPQLEPTASATPIPPTPSPTLATVTLIATSSTVVGWSAYKNEYFGYEFAYPVDARIRTQGVTGFPTSELPENVTAEAYLQQLEATYPDNLCVSVHYLTSFVTFVPAAEKEGRYTVPCGVTGIGDYDIIDLSETVIIDGVPYTASGWRLYERGTDTWHGEFYFLETSDTITIHYGSLTSGTHEVYLHAQQDMMQIVTSFRLNR
jgi:hypothetical protein